jgi:hypothetical protein
MRTTIAVTSVFAGIQLGCAATPLPTVSAPAHTPACEIVPQQHEAEANYARAAGDLHAKFFGTVEAGGGLTTDQQTTVDRTFQTIPDKNQACAMLNATLVCLASGGHEALAGALCRSVSEACAPGLAPGDACQSFPVTTNTQNSGGVADQQVQGNGNTSTISVKP